jgi:arginyl-tRNA synthetase
MSNEIKKIIIKALSELGIEVDDIHLEHPVDLNMGDYSTNVAMVYAKEKKTNPKELAEKIVSHLVARPINYLDKVEVAGPGFINFYLKKEFFVDSVKYVLEKKDDYGKNENLKNKKVMVEYTDPNPFKEIHIGHLMSNAIGESIARIIGSQGANVIRANFQGDVGMHVAKAIFGLIKLKKENFSIEDLAKAYSFGATEFEENKQEITDINKKIYNRSDSQINDIYDKGKKISLDYFETIYKKLGTKFDEYFFESETGVVGKELVEKNIGKVFEKSDGAVVFNGENFGLHTRVFINSEGLPTYEAKDLGLIKTKFEKYPDLDLSISITGNEVNEYFKVMLKAVEKIKSEWAEKTKHISHGMLRLPEGKMSSRTGDVITAESLIKKIEEVISSKSEDQKTIEQVSVGAIKYSILKSSSGKDIIFDFDKSLSVEGNSGPYLQYTYARAKSVLEKAKSEGIKSGPSDGPLSWEISDVEKLLYRFPEIVERAGDEYEPHYIATYLFELAQTFNSFYGNNKIADNTDENAPYKVALTEAVAQTIKNGFYLLGIEVPERL